MQKLYSLIHSVFPGRTTNIESYIKSFIPEKTLYYSLYEAVKHKLVKNDSEAISLLYKNKQGSRFHMLKQRLTERLFNLVLLLRPKIEEDSHYVREILFCHKYYVISKFLLYTGARKLGLDTLHRVLLRAEKIQQYDIVFFCASKLRQEYSYQGNRKAYEQYSTLADRMQEYLCAENKAESIYGNFILHYAPSKARKQHLLREITRAIEILAGLEEKSPTYEIHSKKFRLTAIQYEILGQYKDLVKLAKEEERYLNSNKALITKSRQAHIDQYLLKAYLHLNDLEHGILAGGRALKLYSLGSLNWFSVQEHVFLLYLNNHQIDDASKTYTEVSRLLSLKPIHQRQRENWSIFWGYLWLMIKHHHREDLLRKFSNKEEKLRISKLLNEVPTFSHDKQGAYISIIILQILVLLTEKRYVEIIDKSNALRIYLLRRLRTYEDRRSRLFVKLLLLVIKKDFSKALIDKSSRSLLDQLRKSVPGVHPDLQIEIIAYENLWEFILAKCDP